MRKVLFARSSLFEGEAFSKTMDHAIGEVKTIDGSALTAQVPRYQTSSARSKHVDGDYRVKVTGFGGNFMHDVPRETSRPLNYWAPELVFASQLGPSADIWSLGCTV